MNVHVVAGSSILSTFAGTWLAFVLPEDTLSFGWKIALALPLGVLTGMGSVIGSMLIKRLFAKKESSK